MKLNMYSIYDEKAKAYLPPFVLPETGMAIRTFSDCCNSKDHQFGLHPSHYTLFQIATFDDNDGTLIHSGPKVIGNGVNYLYSPDIEEETLTISSNSTGEAHGQTQ